jgi:hypothetical protein
MPFVKRDEQGTVIAISRESGTGFTEELAAGDPAVSAFANSLEKDGTSLVASDLDLIRVLEDVVELLIAKGVILFTELPADAQQKILRRQRLRARVGDLQNLIDGD